MFFVLPTGIKTRRGVLRWHCMTTNSCTSKASAPEEFWNCADIAVADASGDTGGDVAYDNTALQNMVVENLMPKIQAGTLLGVNHECPTNSDGSLKGVGRSDEYHCGEGYEDGTFAFCRSPSGGGGNMDVQCEGKSPSQINCMEECGEWWYQCANGNAFVKNVPKGTKCKGDEFVVSAVCANYVPSPPPSTTPAPAPQPEEPEPTPEPAPMEC